MYYPVCGMVHILNPMRYSVILAAVRLLLTICPMAYNRKYNALSTS